MSALDDLLIKRYRETLANMSTSEESQANQPVAADVEVANATDVEQPTDAVPSIAISQLPAADGVVAEDTTPSDERDSEVSMSTSANVADDMSAIAEDVEAELDAEEEQADESQSEEIRAEEKLPFKPDWEVDRFLWPVICEQVETRLEKELIRAAEAIVEDCEQRGSNIVAVTTTEDGVGSTTMTLCLAREAARQGLTVAMVDLDHASPSLMDRLGVACEHGIESLQKASIDTENICVTAVEDGVSLLPTMEAIDAEYCASDTVHQMIERVAENHDLVLIDASPEVVDQLSGCKLAAKIGAILVANRAGDEASEICLRKFSNGDIRALGLIENFAA